MNQKQDERLSPMKYHGENKGVTEEFIKNSDEEMCLYWNSYLEAYMEELSMEELKNRTIR